MTGKNKGLAALYRHNVNHELVNVHCFAHRLELAFREVVKSSKLHDDHGRHLFYSKQYKNKKGLMESFSAIGINGTLPPKVTGTRWLAHSDRGLTSHQVCPIQIQRDIISPLIKLSFRLQNENSTLFDSYIAVSSSIKMLQACKSRSNSAGMKVVTWKAAYDESSDSSMIMLIVDLLLTLPPTNVTCETCFSQMKLVKTNRRTRLQSETLNDLLVVRLASPSKRDFNSDPAIDHWMNSSVGDRRLTYKRQKVTVTINLDSESDFDVEDSPDLEQYSPQGLEELDEEEINEIFLR